MSNITTDSTMGRNFYFLFASQFSSLSAQCVRGLSVLRDRRLYLLFCSWVPEAIWACKPPERYEIVSLGYTKSTR